MEAVKFLILLAVVLQNSATAYDGRRHLLSQSDHLDLIHRSMPLLMNKTLTVCVVVREPFVIYNGPIQSATSSGSGTNETVSQQQQQQQRQQQQQDEADINNYSGVVIEVVRRLSVIFRFNIRILRPKDYQFGVLQPDKGWTGLMGALIRQECDVGATALSITVTRAHWVDFTRAYYVETATILLRIPGEVQNYSAIFEPFSLTVWIILLATILILIALITVMTKLEEKQREQRRLFKLARFLATRTNSHAGSVSDAAAATAASQSSNSSSSSSSSSGAERQQSASSEMVAAATAPQDNEYLPELERRLAAIEEARHRQEYGSTWLDRFYYATSCVLNILLIRDIKHPPSQTPIRILVCVWWLSTMVIVNIYLGILFGQLVVPRRPRSIETLEELVNQREVEWCVTQGSAIHELFQRSAPGTVYGQLGRRMHNCSSADQGVKMVLDEGRAFIRERSILTFKMAQEHNRLRGCKLQLAEEDFFSVGFGLALQKGSAYLKAFNAAMTLMIEDGFVARWQAQYWPQRNQFTECQQLESLREGEPLSMKHFISIYLVCSLIICSALIILIYQWAHEHLFASLFGQICLSIRGSFHKQRHRHQQHNLSWSPSSLHSRARRGRQTAVVRPAAAAVAVA